MGSARPSDACKRGFTVVEMLIVISLLAIAGLVVAPTLAPTQPYKVDLAASQFAEAVRFARNEALRMGIPYGVHIDPADRRIRVFRDTSGTLPVAPVFDVIHPVTKRLYDLDLDSLPATAGLTVGIAPLWFGACLQPTLIGFDASGTPRCGDPWNVTLDSISIGLLHDEGQAHIIVLDGVTGRVSVQ